MTRPTVVIYGNCQAQLLHHIVVNAPSLNERYRFLLVTPKVAPNALVEHLPDGLDAATLLWEQYDRREDLALRDRMRLAIPRDCEIVTFPAVGSEAMWPLRARDPRNLPEPGYTWGRYPLGDRIVNEIVGEGATGDEAYALYLERSALAMPDPDRILRIDRYFQAKRDAACDVTLSDALFDEAIYRLRYQFWTYGHIATDVALTILHRLIDRSSGFGPLGTTERAELQAILDRLPGQGDFQQPVHPGAIERLGLRFVDADSRYRWFDQDWTFETYVRKLIAFDRSW